jgi:ABC-2 type transport system permease protein
MTAVLTDASKNSRPLQSRPAETPLQVTPRRVLLSEWTKFRSLRSTLWTLLVGAVLMVGISSLFAAVTANEYKNFDASDLASFSPIGSSLEGNLFAVLAFGVLGVLLFSGEYSTGMIRASLTVVPRRLPVLWAKLGVFAGVVFSISLITSFASFFLGQALLSSKNLDVSISADGALRSVIGAALYLTVAGMIGVALGALLRNTAGGITTFVGVFFVIPPLTQLLPSSLRDNITQYLPSNAGQALFSGTHGVDNVLSPWSGFGVLCIYAVILIGGAAYRLRKVDA